ncbi:MAG: hypothetical protein KF816_17320 [Melioribacteraceae bacterium]|nr:hypothetical protein [Melioribacteraceae bacterium]
MKTQETIDIVEQQIKNLKVHRNIDAPTTLKELDELNHLSFENLLDKLKSGHFQPFLGIGDIYDKFNYMAPKEQKSIARLIINMPNIIAIASATFGVWNGNYLFLLLLIIPYASNFISAFIKINTLSTIITVGLIGYFIYTDNYFAWNLILVAYLSIFFANYYRKYVNNTLIKLSFCNEKVFCFMYYSRVLRLVNTQTNEIIFSK